MGNRRLKQIKEFNNHLNKEFKYGIIVNGLVQTRVDDFEEYKTLSPTDFVNYKAGICWDFAEYEAYAFKTKFHMKQVVEKAPKENEFAIYYVQNEDTKHKFLTHTWIGFCIDGNIYSFESCWFGDKGVKKFSSEAEMVAYYIEQQKVWHSKTGNSIHSAEVYRIPMVGIYGLNVSSFMNKAQHNGTKVHQTDKVIINAINNKLSMESSKSITHDELSMMMELKFNDNKQPFLEKYILEHKTLPQWVFDHKEFITENLLDKVKNVFSSNNVKDSKNELVNTLENLLYLKKFNISDSLVEESTKTVFNRLDILRDADVKTVVTV